MSERTPHGLQGASDACCCSLWWSETSARLGNLNCNRDVQFLLPLARVDVSTSPLSRRMVHSIRFMHDEPHVAGSAVGRQAEIGKRFGGGRVRNADLEHLAGLCGCRDWTAQLLCHAHMPLNHLNRRHTLSLRCIPQVVFEPGARVLSESNANRGYRVAQTEGSLVGKEGPMGC